MLGFIAGETLNSTTGALGVFFLAAVADDVAELTLFLFVDKNLPGLVNVVLLFVTDGPTGVAGELL